MSLRHWTWFRLLTGCSAVATLLRATATAISHVEGDLPRWAEGYSRTQWTGSGPKPVSKLRLL
jgi:hypothetical protein